MFVYFTSKAQPTITPSSFTESVLVPTLMTTTFNHHEVAYIGTPGSTELIAAVFDGTDAGIALSDNAATPTENYIKFTTFSYTTMTAPTTFDNPDIVLLQGGTKAIITFDDATNGAMILELDINTTTLAVSQPTSGLANKIDIPGSFSTEPKIDGDVTNNRFAVCYIKSNEVFYSVYEPLGTSYQFWSSIQNVPATATPPTGGIVQLHPDIALSYNSSSNPVSVVSYREYDPSGTPTLYLNMDEAQGTSSPVNRLNDNVGLTSTFSAMNCGYPRIAGENHVGGISGSNMKWALVTSDLDNFSPSSVAHLRYIHSDYVSVPTGSAYFQLDAPFHATAVYRNLYPSLDWMTADLDAFVAWPTNYVGGANVVDVVGVMTPYNIGSPAYNAWEMVNETTTLPELLNASVSSDPTNLSYCVSYVRSSGSNRYILFKTRMMPNTGFRNALSSQTNDGRDLYPNPANNLLNVQLRQAEKICIYDMYGRLVLKQHGKASVNKIDIETLPNGVYFLHTNSHSSTFTIAK
jgi:hypothetical protein